MVVGEKSVKLTTDWGQLQTKGDWALDGDKSEVWVDAFKHNASQVIAKQSINLKDWLAQRGIGGIVRIELTKIYGKGKVDPISGVGWFSARTNKFVANTARGETVVSFPTDTWDVGYRETIVSLDITDNPVVEFTRVLDLWIGGIGASYGMQSDLGFTFLFESTEEPPAPEPCVISVRVLDVETNLGVKGAVVNLLTGEGMVIDTDTTDSNGNAQVTGIQQTGYVLQATAWGYEKQEKGIDTGWTPSLSEVINISKAPPIIPLEWLPWIIGGVILVALVYFLRHRIPSPMVIYEKIRGCGD